MNEIRYMNKASLACPYFLPGQPFDSSPPLLFPAADQSAQAYTLSTPESEVQGMVKGDLSPSLDGSQWAESAPVCGGSERETMAMQQLWEYWDLVHDKIN